MPIIKHDPWRGFLAFPRIMDDIDEMVGQRGLKIYETEKDIVAEAVVAGVPADLVDAHIEDGVLTIKAEVKNENSAYSYYYTAALSGGQWNKADAVVKDGVVHITIPKTESSKPHKISVKGV